jgi:phage repressor protein C with HTH and peptisase S24 domain/transcriptional regulator with XRE-family HTH domain
MKNSFYRPASLLAFGRSLRRARENKGLTLESLAAATGISKPYLAHIETARAPGPPTAGKLKSLARALGLEAAVLEGAADWLRTPASVRRAILGAGEREGAVRGEAEHRRDVDATAVPRRGDGAIDLDAMMKAARGTKHEDMKIAKPHEKSSSETNLRANISNYNDLIGVKQVPLINRVAAGRAGEFGDLSYPAGVADAYVAAPDLPETPAGSLFAVKVTGDSMMPEYREGDVVIAGPGEARDGDDCVVRLGEGENFATTFKRVFFEREGEEAVSVRLVPLNPAHAERRVALEEISGIYPMEYRLVPRRGVSPGMTGRKASEKLRE